MSGGNRNPSYLTLPSFANNQLASGGTFSFYYHMYGATIGTLSAQSCVGSTCTTRWTRTRQQHTSNGAAWSRAVVTYPAGTTRLRLVAIGGTSYTGDISVDTLQVVSAGATTRAPTRSPTRSPTSAPTAATLPWNCNFNSGSGPLRCGWTSTNRWQLRTGGTPSFGTGPNRGQVRRSVRPCWRVEWCC